VNIIGDLRHIVMINFTINAFNQDKSGHCWHGHCVRFYRFVEQLLECMELHYQGIILNFEYTNYVLKHISKIFFSKSNATLAFSRKQA
jgi:hypothetical protein